MTTTASSPLRDETMDAAIARIDAEDETYIAPIREFLQTVNCEVFVNQPPPRLPQYHIVAGKREFVKTILLSPPAAGQKRLAIVVGESPLPPQWQQTTGAKMICIDSVVPTTENVRRILAFFFTDPQPLLDLRPQRPDLKTIPVESELSGEIESVQIEPVQSPPPKSDQLANTLAQDRQRIEETIASVFTPPAAQTHRHYRKRVRLTVWSAVWLVFLSAIFPLLWYLGSVSASAAALAFANRRLLSGNTNGVAGASGVAEYWVGQATSALTLLSVPLRALGMEGRVRGQERLLSLLSDVSVSQQGVVSLLATGQQLSGSLLAATGTRPEAEPPVVVLTKLRTRLYTVQNHLGLAQANLESLLQRPSFPFSLAPVAEIAIRQGATLSQMREQLVTIDQLLTLYPQLAGFRQKQTYLILLQNSLELRPTGGFIGSLGLASFVDGKLEEFQIQDVYTVDGQLRGHVDPPKPIRELLGQEHWYLRDSNWNPDFYESGTRAAWFYEKETGVRVDGVIAISVPYIVKLLGAVGPIELPDYNDRITAENFYGKSLYYTQTNFFPGSTQKKDFLGALASALVAQLTSAKKADPAKILRATTDALWAHDIMFAFTRPQLQSLTEHYGWAGRILTSSTCLAQEGESCVWDPLVIAEANLSVSKVNYFVSRSQIRQITLDDQGQLQASVALVYRNSATVAQTGVGTYRAYVQVLLPSDATISDITLDGNPIAERGDEQKLGLLPYREESEPVAGLTGWGIAFDLPPQQERRLTVVYSRGVHLDLTQGKAVYLLSYQKQPGINPENVQVLFESPAGWSAALDTVANGASPMTSSRLAGRGESGLANQGRVEYNTTLVRDLKLNLILARD